MTDQTPSRWSEYLMGIIVLILIIYYVIIPLISLIKPLPNLQLPSQAWNLFQIVVPVNLLHAHLPNFLNKILPPKE